MRNTNGITLSFDENKRLFEKYFKVKFLRVENSIKCPFHDDSKASLSVNVSKGVYFCHGCGAKGGTQKILKLTKGEI